MMEWETIIKQSEGVREVNAFMMWMNNTSPADIVEMLFGEVYGGYDQKWINLYRQGFNHFWVALDDGNRSKLMEAALKKYG